MTVTATVVTTTSYSPSCTVQCRAQGQEQKSFTFSARFEGVSAYVDISPTVLYSSQRCCSPCCSCSIARRGACGDILPRNSDWRRLKRRVGRKDRRYQRRFLISCVLCRVFYTVKSNCSFLLKTSTVAIGHCLVVLFKKENIM